ncbi:hypothetical protein [Pseudoxanthomonas sp. Root630]|uniref:hypothetical protein n=1 Tax=Pseudoxanthomonas sp. Root630 TaxID=1736574 RepID=UPI000703AC55|nr:hypothetical protein [Pseudoxanthomonas sp. Root630]KRA40132.1 hypothetical protein ASD72_17045 [Pseudoxanthomonas sp. Root630]
MSTQIDTDAVRQRYRDLDADALMRIALATTDEYGDDAILLARQELLARGVRDARFDTPPGRSPPPIPNARAAQPRDHLPWPMKLLCVVVTGAAIFVAAGYMLAGKKNAGGEALFLMVVGWFGWFLLVKLIHHA